MQSDPKEIPKYNHNNQSLMMRHNINNTRHHLKSVCAPLESLKNQISSVKNRLMENFQ